MENLQWVSIDISVIGIDSISIEYLLIALKKPSEFINSSDCNSGLLQPGGPR